LYPATGRATNWQQFCCRYKKHVDGNMLPGNMLPWCKRGFRLKGLQQTYAVVTVMKSLNGQWTDVVAE